MMMKEVLLRKNGLILVYRSRDLCRSGALCFGPLHCSLKDFLITYVSGADRIIIPHFETFQKDSFQF